MAIKLASNLHRNRFGILYFRLTVPVDLQKHFATKVIYRSLRTSNIREAVDASQALALPFRRLFNELRQKRMTDKSNAPKIDLNTFAALPDVRQRLKIAGLNNALDNMAEQSIQQENQVVNLGVELSRQEQTHREHLAAIYEARIPQSPATPSINTTKLLSEYVAQYADSINADREVADQMNDQGIKDHRNSAVVFIEIVGDKSLHELTIPDRNRFDEVIKRYPANRTKVTELHGLTINEIVDRGGYEAIHLKTAKYHSRRINHFLNWVAHQEGVDVPFLLLEKVKIKKVKDAEKIRRAFTADELRKLFDATAYPCPGSEPKKLPNRFWIPLIALHSGARINEIAQLRLNDIVWEDGVACFNITDTPDNDELHSTKEYIEKAVKTFAGKRLVPIHSRLIDLGFLDYIAQMTAQKSVLVFEDLSHAKNKYGSLVSKWFARYCNGVGLTDDSLTFHGFRHGAIGKMRRSGIPKHIRMIVVGHSATQDTNDEYGNIYTDVSTTARQAAIESLDFSESLDFGALKLRARTFTC